MKNKSLFGIILGAAALVLAVSPEGRKAVRKFAVKGTGAWLDIKDQIKEVTSEFPSGQMGSKREIEDPIPKEI
ncbi:hypothetical protein [Paenibacillus sp. N3.4]|uniref:hypothetical protein n=1 Tax=Paenibacillus sp. N3.4 TaxID=2603222 RepID=UPI0011C97AAF|nr:hypothetical protein [Paenibacillus sp. N3.4]TXK84358.1 hypothetical protein FU659_08985 [Paenibacillus sp. N3.4]